ncbi:MAG: SPASM domain-containing protein [Chloroflexi bacterium]|nr:SPASM domain-containing protein [Chloroflexota bacterium]MDA1271633.1 SPASM domain-containing protein [Chloroflexota bacterium]
MVRYNPFFWILKIAIYVGERWLQVNGGVIESVADGRRDQRFWLAARYFSWRKFWNFLRVESQLRFTKRIVSGSPYEWEIDTTNICQLKCPLCHTGKGTIHRDQGVMDYGLFTETVDQIKDSCMWLTLYSWGEPFLNARIHEYIAYAHKQKIATIISSNLNKPLTPEMAEQVIRSGLDVMIVSLDGVTQDVYEIYRVTGHMDRVLDNLRLLDRKKRELGSKTPHIEWQFIVMRQNEHQLDEARQLAGELGVDSLVFKKVDFPHGEDDPAEAERWLPRQHPEYLRDEPFHKPYQEDGRACWRLWRSAVVNWDGGVSPCCYLTDKTEDFGDLNESTVKAVWNNAQYTTARGLFNKGITPEKWVGCLDCSVYKGSAAARRRGPVELQPEPLLLQVNGVKPSHGNGAKAEDSVPAAGVTLDPHDETPLETKKEEPV